jgi:cell division protein ZapD
MQVDHFRPQADPWSNRAAIDGLLSIISIFGRSDLKTEILKELERHTSNLERVRLKPGVDIQALGQIVDDLEQAIHQVYRLNGQIARDLRNNEFLTTILQRSSIPGGNCNFDLPQYHHWLNQPHEVRQRQMSDWLHELLPVREAVVLLLNLVRSSNLPSQELAKQGFFQRTLDRSAPAQMIRVSLPHNSTVFTETSGTKHRFNIRFLEVVDSGKPSQTKRDIEFLLTTCVF